MPPGMSLATLVPPRRYVSASAMAMRSSRIGRCTAPRQGRLEIGDRGAAAPALADGVLVAADALVVAAVEIGVPFQAGGLARRGVGLRQRVREGRPAGAEWAVAAAMRARAVLPGLLLFEIGQCVGVGP